MGGEGSGPLPLLQSRAEQRDEENSEILEAFEAKVGNLGKPKDTAFFCCHDLQPVIPEAGVQVQLTRECAWILKGSGGSVAHPDPCPGRCMATYLRDTPQTFRGKRPVFQFQVPVCPQNEISEKGN